MFPADLVTFTEEILNGKRIFLCCECFGKMIREIALPYFSKLIIVVERLLTLAFFKAIVSFFHGFIFLLQFLQKLCHLNPRDLVNVFQ